MIARLNAIRGSSMGGDEYRVLNKPRAFVYRAATHNVATGGGYVPIQWDGKVYDTDSMWKETGTAAERQRFTCNTPGEYAVWGFVLWPASAASYRQLVILRNGGGQAIFSGIIAPNAVPTSTGQEINRVVTLNKDDYIELGAAQNTGGTLTLPASPAFATYDHGFQACLVSTLG